MKTDTYESFMLDHAAGSLNPGLHLAADIHVALHPDGQTCAALWEIVGGALLERDMAETTRKAPKRRPRGRSCHMAVEQIINTDFDTLHWNRSLSGARMSDTGFRGTHFMGLDAGQSVPLHNHSVLEATVVLTGALEIDGQVFTEGDIAIGAPGEPHKPTAYGDAPCVCFVAREDKPFWRLT